MAITLSGLNKEKKIPPKKTGKKLDNQLIKNNLTAFKAITSGLKDTTQKVAQEEFQSKSRKESNIIEDNRRSEDLKTGNKPATNRTQTDNKMETNQEQTSNKPTTMIVTKKETGNKVGTQPTTLSATKWQQTDNKVATKTAFSSLVGLQRNIMIFLYGACKIARGRSTDSLTLEHLAHSLKTSSGSIKTTIQRLENKGCIKRAEFKNGRGGWSKYELLEGTFREMLQLETENKLTTNWQQSDNKVGTKPATQPTTSLSSSSSYINNTTTEESHSIDLKPLEAINFSKHHLKQIRDQKIFTDGEIQKSIDAFAHDLQNAQLKNIRNPLGYFMSVLKGGNPYVSAVYEDPQEKHMRENLERLKKKREEKEKMVREVFELKFAEWLDTKGKEELVKLVPPMGDYLGAIHKSGLKDFFKENILDNPEN
jgi:hypothetical protein